MKYVEINSEKFYYYESDDPVIQHLVTKKQLFGYGNFKLLFDFILNKNLALVDCGAHIGTFSFVPAINNMRVLAIDGAEKNVECLRKTFEGKDNIIVEHQILLDDIKKCSFTDDYGPYGSAYESNDGNVESNTLDNLINKHNLQVGAIKYDIEGNEIEALLGSKETLEKYKPPLLLEVNGHCLRLHNKTPKDLFQILEDFNYKCYLPIDSGLMCINKNNKWPLCVSDIIAVHKDNMYNYLQYPILEPFTQNHIEDLIGQQYKNSNDDCKQYFDTLS